jgi:signal peptidase I
LSENSRDANKWAIRGAINVGVAVFLYVANYWRGVFRRTSAPATGSAARFGAVLTGLVVATLLARATVTEIFQVVGPSMTPTLNAGDRLLVNKLAYGLRMPLLDRRIRVGQPRRGDVVVFRTNGAAGGGEAPTVVKRVIGLPGDVISFSGGSPVINGWLVPSCDAGPFLTVVGPSVLRGRLVVEVLDDRAHLTVRTQDDETRLAAFKVPSGEVFVLGDDRGVSRDSRAWNEGRGGGLRIDNIIGRVSRLAIGGFRNGQLDRRRLLAPLRLEVREANVDLRRTQQRIAACLAHPPRSSRPPAPP